MRIVFHIDPASGTVTRNGVEVLLAPDTPIAPEDGIARTLGSVLDAYAQATDFVDVSKIFKDDVQAAIGHVLYTALGGAEIEAGDARWLEIAVDDGGARMRERGFIERLPWILTARPQGYGSSFLVQDGDDSIVMTLDGDPRARKADQLFPLYPRVLLMIPHQHPDTAGPAHEAEIVDILKTCYGDALFEANVRIVRTWPDAHKVMEAASDFAPQVIYFYGHGEKDGTGCRLTFDQPGNQLTTVRANQIGAVLRSLPPARRPAVFFANCCHGASASRAGLGPETAHLVGCLVANRTVADVQAAREFGLALLRHIVCEGEAPHIALGAATSHVIEAVAGADIGARWACPVVYTNYARWIALEPTRRKNFVAATAGCFVERVDRMVPIRTAAERIALILSDRDIELHALAWQGEPPQGVEAFSRRLRDDILERFPTRSVREVFVEMQSDAVAAGDDNRRLGLLTAIYAALVRPAERAKPPTRSEIMEKTVARLRQHLTSDGAILLVRIGPVPVEGEAGRDLVRCFWRIWIDLRHELVRTAGRDLKIRIIVAIALSVPSGRSLPIKDLLRPPEGDEASGVTSLGHLESVQVTDITSHLGDFASAYGAIGRDEHPARALELHAATGGVFEEIQIRLKKMAGLI